MDYEIFLIKLLFDNCNADKYVMFEIDNNRVPLKLSFDNVICIIFELATRIPNK